MGRYTEPLKKEDVMARVSAFLDKHIPNEEGDTWTPVSREDLVELSNVFYDITACKWERDCDGSLPVDFEICNRKVGHFVPYCRLPYNNDNLKNSRVAVLADLQKYVGRELSYEMRRFLSQLADKESTR